MDDEFVAPHRALLLFFQDSHLTTATEALGASMRSMGWDVILQTLDNQDSKQAQNDLNAGYQTLVSGIEPGTEQGLMVFYGGYGLQVARGTPFRLEGHETTWKAMKWHPAPVEGHACSNHTVTVDPEAMLLNLYRRVSNDVLFILNSPGELQHSVFEVWKCRADPESSRNVQVLHLRENWSGETGMRRCDKGEGLPCGKNPLQVPSGFVDEPVKKIAESLRWLADHLDEDLSWTFYDAYKAIWRIGRREAEVFPVQGLPKGHFLTKGMDELVFRG